MGLSVNGKRYPHHWKFSWREGTFGHLYTRWFSHTLWWTDEYKEFSNIKVDGRNLGIPVRINYFGKKICWSLGNKSQVWSWKKNIWTDKWRWFILWPTDYRERWIKAGKPPGPYTVKSS